MSLQVKRIKWLRSPSAWQSEQSWRQKRHAANEQSRNMASNAISMLSSAASNQILGSGSLAAKIASDRIKSEAQAKLDTLA
jgi:hypothetical protein